jgi:hypothetical protein
MLRRPFLVAVVAGLLLVGGCSPSDDATSDETTTTTAAPSTTTAPTTTVASTTTAAAATTEALPEGEESGSGEPWDLVWISDSIGERVAGAWADQIEESEGVEVRVHNHIGAFLTIENALVMITGNAAIRDEVADAEIIVVFGNPAQNEGTSDVETCARSGTDPREPPGVYTSADFAPYGDVFRDVFDTIFELRAAEPTVIRTYDVFAGPLPDWREAGIEPECTAAWEAQADAIHEAADEYGVLTASFYDEFNGPDHDEDAREKGYIAADGFHQSMGAGVTAQVEVLHALGYEPIVP